MAAANLSDNNSATASSANHSPRHSGQNISSPKARRSTRTVSSPWTQIVRGELDTIAAVPSSLSNLTSPTAVVEPVSFSSSSASSPPAAEEPVGESSDSGNGSFTNAGKKPVWNKLSNGTAGIGPVMGGVAWPPLSESTKATTKTSSESLKGSADGSVGGAWQGIGNLSPASQKEVSNDASPSSHSTPTHPMTSRQKSMRRNGASNSYNSGLPQQSALPSSVTDTAPNNPAKDQTQRTVIASQSHNDHGYQQQRNSFRNRGGGSHPRGDGSHHHNHGSRRDHDRGNQDWNPHRNFNGQPQRVVPRFRPPGPPLPPSTATFIPQPMRPLGGPIPFPEFAHPMVYVAPPPEALRGVPFVTPIPPNAVFFPAPDPQLHAKIVKQIDYYFSGENLIKDTFLRKNMDEYGWVPIKLIAGFNKVLYLTDNIQLILDALQSSMVVEVQGDKVRRRNDWSRWIMPPSAQIPNVAGPLSPGKSSQDMMAAGFQGISLGKTINYISTEGQSDHAEALQGGLYGNLSSQMQPYGDDVTGQVNIKAGSDHFSSERS